MTRLNLVLLIAVLASALYLVRTQYESRRLYVELEKAAAQSRKLESDNERLQVEKRAQATPLRVEKLAKENLQMRTVTPAITQYATDSSAPRAAASATVVEKTEKKTGATARQSGGTP
ncbi:MAG: cell division protein FtsL [Polaromonas sp.]|uniref:cell division protein FtsL n=1 Tax=Polaromonas sp. TaxID=1869339 RepID=UPI0025DB493F|nr:cell division protein FtsL [Polaromonas sp.]MBI2725986.1 cell division protein FtsL [Polaromonas sp.]